LRPRSRRQGPRPRAKGGPHLIGKVLIDLKDPDGKLFVKERVELARKQPSFWQNYKFMNPATKKVEPKQMYCERLNDTAVCGGVYSF